VAVAVPLVALAVQEALEVEVLGLEMAGQQEQPQPHTVQAVVVVEEQLH
jgi:hypothetical protein